MQIEGMIQGRALLFAYNVLEIDYSEYAMLFKIEKSAAYSHNTLCT